MATVKRRVEIELTSSCNAACPGCARTHLKEKGIPFPRQSIDTSTLFTRFSELDLANLDVKLCGVLGDPLSTPKSQLL